MRLFKRKSKDDLDLQTLKQLEKNGANLANPRLLEHFIYVRSEADAKLTVTALVERGYTAKAEGQADGSPQWVVFATNVVVPSPENIRQLRGELTAIAEANSGHYDGWGSLIKPNEG